MANKYVKLSLHKPMLTQFKPYKLLYITISLSGVESA